MQKFHIKIKINNFLVLKAHFDNEVAKKNIHY